MLSVETEKGRAYYFRIENPQDIDPKIIEQILQQDVNKAYEERMQKAVDNLINGSSKLEPRGLAGMEDEIIKADTKEAIDEAFRDINNAKHCCGIACNAWLQMILDEPKIVNLSVQ